jgi:hypothetical protein
MMSKHNKKRNVGLVYQQVLRRAAEAAVDGDKAHANECIALLEKHFMQGTELYKEHRLFRSILDTHGVDTHMSDRVLAIAKEVSRSIDPDTIARQKGAFINEANRMFGKGVLFDTQVENYRGLATVQLLINEWRHPGTLSPDETAIFENRLQSYMMSNTTPEVIQKEERVDDLTVSMFQKRFDESYGTKLNAAQKEFVVAIAFDNNELVNSMIAEAKSHAVNLLDARMRRESNQMLIERHESVRRNIINFECSDEESRVKAMTLFSLIEELENEDV